MDQNISFNNLPRDAYEFVALKSYYKSAMQIVETKLSIMNDEYKATHGRSPIQMTTSRLKEQKSIVDKMIRHGYPITPDYAIRKIKDLAGVRAICAFEHDVYYLADMLLKHADVTLLEKKDFIKMPKASGYRSLHLIISVPIYLAGGKRDVTVEVQLRTISMDYWAGLEHALRYKQSIEYTEELNREILECARLTDELDERMSKLHKDLTRYIASHKSSDPPEKPKP